MGKLNVQIELKVNKNIESTDSLKQIIRIPKTNLILLRTQNVSSGATTLIYYDFVNEYYTHHQTVETTFVDIVYSTDLDQWVGLTSSYVIIMDLYQFKTINAYLYKGYIRIVLFPGTFKALLTQITYQAQEIDLLNGNALNQYYTVKPDQTPLSSTIADFVHIPATNYGFQVGGGNMVRCWDFGDTSNENKYRQIFELKVGVDTLSQIGLLLWDNKTYVYVTEVNGQALNQSKIYLYETYINEEQNQCSLTLIKTHQSTFQNVHLINGTKKFVLSTVKDIYTIDDIFNSVTYRSLTSNDTLNYLNVILPKNLKQQMISPSHDSMGLNFIDYKIKVKKNVPFQNGIHSYYRSLITVDKLDDWIVFFSKRTYEIYDSKTNGIYFYNYITGEVQYLEKNFDRAYAIYIDSAQYYNNKVNICLRISKSYFLNDTVTQDYKQQIYQKYKYHNFECLSYSLVSKQHDYFILDLQNQYPNGLLSSPSGSAFHFDRKEFFTFQNDGTFHIWDSQTFKYKSTVQTNCTDTYTMKLLQKYNSIVIDCYNDQTIRLFNISKNFQQEILEKHNTWMSESIVDEENGLAMFQGSDDQLIRVFDLNQKSGLNLILKLQIYYAFDLQFLNYDVQKQIIISGSTEIIFTFDISTCIQAGPYSKTDLTICSVCQNEYIFKITDKYGNINNSEQFPSIESKFYGQGTQDSPYTQSRQILEQQIKVSFALQSMTSLTKIKSQIKIDTSNSHLFVQNSHFQNNFSLKEEKYFKPLIDDTNAILQYKYNQKAQFSNFKNIEFKNIIFEYDFTSLISPDSEQYKCGIFLKDSGIIKLINYKFQFIGASVDVNKAPFCGQITLDNASLILQDTKFTKSFLKDILFISLNAPQITLNNTEISNCNLSTLHIMHLQVGQTDLQIQDFKFMNNIGQMEGDSSIGQLFEFTTINIQDLAIENNQLKNYNFFNSQLNQVQKLSDQVRDNTFIFTNIIFRNNTIQTFLKTIFGQMKFPSLDYPDFTIIATNIKFENNTVQILQATQNDQAEDPSKQIDFLVDEDGVSFQQQEQQSAIQNQNDDINQSTAISFISIFSSYNLARFKLKDIFLIDTLNVGILNCYSGISFNSVNIQAYNSEKPTIQAITPPPVIFLFEIAEFLLLDSLFKNLYLKNQPIINILNSQTSQSTLTVQGTVFNNNYMHSTRPFYSVNPIQINSNSPSVILLSSNYFLEGYLDSTPNNFLPSTNAFWIENIQGNVTILNTQFINNYSSGLYNIMKIITNTVNITGSLFSNSSFPDASKNNFQQSYEDKINTQGAFINVESEQIYIFNTTLMKSYAKRNPFMYLASFSNTLEVEMDKCTFKDSYSIQGSAIEIYVSSNLITLSISNSSFQNIFLRGDSIQLFKLGLNLNKQVKDQIQFKNIEVVNIYSQQRCSLLSQYSGILNLESVDILSNKKELNITPFFKEIYENQIFCSQIDSYNNQIDLKKYNLKDIFQVFIKQIGMENSDAFQNQLIITDVNSEINIESMIIDSCNLLPQQRLIQAAQKNLTFSDMKVSNITLLDSLKDVNTKDLSFSQGSIYLESTEFKIQNSTFQEINCTTCIGGVFQLRSSFGSFYKTNFLLNKANSGGSISIERPIKEISIKECTFEKNYAFMNGGDIYFFNNRDQSFTISLEYCQFKQSASFTQGGSLYLEQSFLPSEQNKFQINNVQFYKTNSKVGGAIFFKNIIPMQNDVQYQNTFATSYGQKDFSFPTKVKLLKINNNNINNTFLINETYTIIKLFKSGDSIPQLDFHFLDQYDEVVKLSEKADIQLKKTEMFLDEKINDINSFQLIGIQKGQYDINTFTMTIPQNKFVGIPGQTVKLHILFDQVSNMVGQSIEENNYYHHIEVQFRECLVGEVKKVSTIALNQVTSNLTECILCGNQTYSFDFLSCNQCPTGAKCLGGSRLSLEEGYWREEQYSDEIFSCFNLKGNCVGGEGFQDQLCFEGHIGPLCEECDIYGEVWNGKYSRTGQYSCTNCNNIQGNFIMLILSYIFLQISLIFAIKNQVTFVSINPVENQIQKTIQNKITHSNSNSNSNDNTQTNFNQNGDEKNQKSKEPTQKKTYKKISSQSAVIIKFMTHYFQIMSSISGFDVQIPKGLIDLPSPLRTSISNLQCYLSEVQDSIPLIYFRFIFASILPLVYFIIFLIKIRIMLYFMKKPFGIHILYSSGLFILFYTQPDLFSYIIQLVSCRVINNQPYILANLTYSCYTKNYYYYGLVLVFPVFLIVLVGLPFTFLIILFRNRNNLTDSNIILRFGFLLREYKKTTYYWEFIRMAERIGLIFALNYYSQDFITKACLLLIIISLYWKFMLIKKPYPNPTNLKIDHYLCMTCFVTVLFCLFLHQQSYIYFKVISFIVIAIFNLTFIVFIIKKIAYNYYKKIKLMIFGILTSSFVKRYLRIKFKFIERQKKIEQIRLSVQQKLNQAIQEICKAEFYQNSQKRPLQRKKKQTICLSPLRQQDSKKNSVYIPSGNLLKPIEFAKDNNKQLIRRSINKILTFIKYKDYQLRNQKINQKDSSNQINESKLSQTHMLTNQRSYLTSISVSPQPETQKEQTTNQLQDFILESTNSQQPVIGILSKFTSENQDKTNSKEEEDNNEDDNTNLTEETINDLQLENEFNDNSQTDQSKNLEFRIQNHYNFQDGIFKPGNNKFQNQQKDKQ